VDSGEVPRSSAQVGDDAYLHQKIAFGGVFTPVLAKHSKSYVECGVVSNLEPWFAAADGSAELKVVGNQQDLPCPEACCRYFRDTP
jgi:hypothetical protein